MERRVRSLLSVFVIACVVTVATLAVAHPPWNPFDNTRFAPITRFGPNVGIEVVTKGDATNPLTSPLKAVAAPGLRNYLFIVDQPGILRAVNPSDPTAGVVAGRRELIRANWPQFNHDGGDLAFGPDRKLYISMGDGGGADDADGQFDSR